MSSSARSTSLTAKRSVVSLGLLGAAVLLVSGTRAWVHGTVVDAVLGRAPGSATGSQVAPAAVAAGLVAAAAAVACATSGAVIRRVAAVALLLSAVLGAGSVIGVARDPALALGRASATALGRRDAVQALGSASPWLWIAAVACLLVAVAGVGAVLGAGRWRSLSSRYDAPSQAEPGARQRAARPRTAWDDLSEGNDPTLPGPDGDT